MSTVLWIIGALPVIGGIDDLFREVWVRGIVLVVVGGLIGGSGFL